MHTIYINGNSLELKDLVDVSRNDAKVQLSEEAISKIKESRDLVDEFVEKEEIVYGITTGFGKFSDVSISKEDTETLQTNLIRSHACGVGRPLSEEDTRGAMLLRINTLAKGHSGIRLETLNTLIEMLNKGVHPIIPEKGSLGASGDLAPLAHMVLVMLGEGEAYYEGVRMTGKEAMEKAGIPTIQLTSKEGLALINGTPVMTAIGGLIAYDSLNLIKIADISAALTIEALNGIIDAYDQRVHSIRPHKGQINCAENLLNLTKSSQLISRQGEIRVQDAYTLRCIPQIHGASRDAINYVVEKVNIEINSVTDNPLIFAKDRDVISGGNFHGQPMALAFDFLGIALAELANSSERRIERLVNPQLSGLPGFLTENGGLNSGFMIPQYTAASLVSENKVLAHPASVDSIPSSANQEDHVSMGTIAARKAKEILYNTTRVLAIELFAATQAIDFGEPEKLGEGTKLAYEEIRKEVDRLYDDRIMNVDIDACARLIESNTILDAVEGTLGKLL
ncbi:MAG: histidine ammonia-lyase [Tissierellia bacterium]|nr:histidine ammonia-lyase [Tissierellia bacterium]